MPASDMEEIPRDSKLWSTCGEGTGQALCIALKPGALICTELALGVETELSVDMKDGVAEEHLASLGVVLGVGGERVADMVEDGNISTIGDDNVSKCFCLEVAKLEGEVRFDFC